ncbi:hypothetical protein V2H45_14465 [Tumidithrix elongata RA019]|uniref:FecR protein domain-containing protein n=1 Tax=Tumidithrix elongata BACA0141 TaxID=2716417 RepID=A0AAW9Q3F9_9CYAN|nr:hypothetical protein [Tumidithrix elongata RA019]
MKAKKLSTQQSESKQAKSTWLSKLRQRLLFFFIGVCFVSLLAPQLASVVAQDVNQARVKEVIDGNQVYIQERQANVNDVAQYNESVRTGNAKAELGFNTGAVFRLSQNSALTVGQCLRLDSGVLLVNGPVNACTSSITAGVQGTTYVIEVDDKGNQKVTVLEGEVVVKKTKKTTPSNTNPTPKPGTTSTDPTSKPSTTKQIRPTQQTPPKPPSFPDPNTQPTKPLTDPSQSSSDSKPVLEVKPQTSPSPSPSSSDTSDTVVLKSGQKLEVDAQGALGIIQKLTQGEFEGLLGGNLFKGFTDQLPSIDKIRSSFEGLFPGVSFPIPNLPSIPRIPTPSIPGLPF